MSIDELVDECLEEWEVALENGKVLSATDLVSPGLAEKHPDLVPVLDKKITALKTMGLWFSPEETNREDSSYETTDPCRLSGKEICYDGKLKIEGFYRKGGVGAIYYAQQSSLGRQVALKSLLPSTQCLDSFSSKEAADRFQAEAEITSRLEHPGIIPIYQSGWSDSQSPFYTMRFVQDACLDDHLADFHHQQLSPNESEEQFLFLLQNFSSACKTIGYAHSRGIVHRDIKPQNILIGKYGETLVIDWGLAKTFKRTGQFKTVSEETLDVSSESRNEKRSDTGGTIAYMSPQQHQGRIPAPSDDIYSLGATLYKILCGKSPVHVHSDLSLDEVRQKVIDGDLVSASKIHSEVSPEVESICKKAMSIRSADRYETALELAADIDHFVAGNPVSTFKDPIFKSAARWLSRHLLTSKLLVTAVATLTIILIGLSSLFLHSSSVHNEARKKNLVSLASSYARRVGQDLDARIRILEHESQSRELQRLVMQWHLNQGREQEPVKDPLVRRQRTYGPLADWAERVVSKYDGSENQKLAFKAICVYDNKGIMIARCGTESDLLSGETRSDHNNVKDGSGTKVLGQNFVFRDYFHAKGYDLPQQPKTQISIHKNPFYISSVYKSKSSGDFHFQITVPILDPEKPDNGQPIGLLGMAMQIGQMNFPENGIVVSDRKASSKSKSVSQSGLIIHNKSNTETTYLSPKSLGTLKQTVGLSGNRLRSQLLPAEFRDKAIPQIYGSLQAACRIKIPGRFDDAGNPVETKWLLIAVEESNHE